PVVDRDSARAAEHGARAAMIRRLQKLDEVEIAGSEVTSLQLDDPERDEEAGWASVLRGSRGLLRSGLRLGILQLPVLHHEHYARLGHDRQPAGVEELERIGAEIKPLPKTEHTLAVLSSPTGWDAETREHVRALQPGDITIVLK